MDISHSSRQIHEGLVKQLRRRGPDGSAHHSCAVGNLNVLAYGYVLHMRGRLTLQPAVETKTRDWLLWNGEVFGGDVNVCACITAADTVNRMLPIDVATCAWLHVFCSKIIACFCQSGYVNFAQECLILSLYLYICNFLSGQLKLNQ